MRNWPPVSPMALDGRFRTGRAKHYQVAVLADEIGADAVHSLLADQIRSEAIFLQSVRVHLQY